MPTIDFDAARAERNAEPVTLTLGGVTYVLPPALPADIALDLIRLRSEAGDGAEVPIGELHKFAHSLLGAEAEAIIARITLPELEDLLVRLIAIYAPSPNRQARRAQKAAGSR
jgi:hypothetical protein